LGQLRSPSTKDQILDAALVLLGDRGLRALTQPQVAKKAKVRQSHLTYYFPKRGDLLAAVTRRYLDRVTEAALELSSRGESPNALAAAVLGDRRRVRTLIALFGASEEEPQLRAQLVRSVLASRAAMALALGVEESDPRAALLQATLWGLGLQHLVLKDQSQKQLRALVDLAGALASIKSRNA
jgi:AcrR family transcriptional regulator